MNESWIDVTVPVRSGMVHWPGNPPIEVTRTADVSKGDPATVSHLSLGVHSGTHVDAPAHFIADGAGIDTVPLADLIGPARVVSIRDPRAIGVDELLALEPRRGERLLFKTRNSNLWSKDEFATDYVYLSLEGAKYLVESGVRTIGIDYLSIAGAHEGVPTHLALLHADVCIIEGLDLKAVEPGAYEMICLPLRLLGADGAPARVVLRSTAA
jgi:arylformamidase